MPDGQGVATTSVLAGDLGAGRHHGLEKFLVHARTEEVVDDLPLEFPKDAHVTLV